MIDLKSRLASFDPITLQEMEDVKLLDRQDTKFTFHFRLLDEVLAEMSPDYRILEVNGFRGNRYETLYFDTNSLNLFSLHHKGCYCRYKIRYRRYVESDLCFFEIKVKNNKGRTIKSRIRRPAIETSIAGEAETLLRQATPLAPSDFTPALWVHFTRLTFVNKHGPERMTIDVDLSYQNGNNRVGLNNLVIAEVKRERSTAFSPFVELMRLRRLWEGSMSKYCFGVTQLYPSVKMNLFKERVKQIKELAA